MKIYKFTIAILALSLILNGCFRVSVIKTGATTSVVLPDTNPADVVIYRSLQPEWRFQEIGVVTVTNTGNMEKIYEKMREAAGKKGADAIIGLKLDSSKSVVPVTQSHAGPNGAVYTTTSMQTVVHYTTTGTLIHKLETK